MPSVNMQRKRLSEFIPIETIRKCIKVLQHGDGKHPNDEWKTLDANVHLEHAMAHLEAYKEDTLDAETGESHIVHAIVRLLMYEAKCIHHPGVEDIVEALVPRVPHAYTAPIVEYFDIGWDIVTGTSRVGTNDR